MSKLKRIWIESNADITGSDEAIRIDWDNDRHQRIEIKGKDPAHLIDALKRAEIELKAELYRGNI